MHEPRLLFTLSIRAKSFFPSARALPPTYIFPSPHSSINHHRTLGIIVSYFYLFISNPPPLILLLLLFSPSLVHSHTSGAKSEHQQGFVIPPPPNFNMLDHTPGYETLTRYDMTYARRSRPKLPIRHSFTRCKLNQHFARPFKANQPAS